MEDPECAAITEKAFTYFKLSYQEKVGSYITVTPNVGSGLPAVMLFCGWSSGVCQVSHWQGQVKPSRWPQMLAALSYAEKLIGESWDRWRKRKEEEVSNKEEVEPNRTEVEKMFEIAAWCNKEKDGVLLK